MKSISVPLKTNSYKIQFGNFSSGFCAALKKTGVKKAPVFVVTTQAVKKAGWALMLIRSLKKNGYEPHLEVLPNGESIKNSQTLSRLYKAGLRFGLDRKSLVIGFGGGVITDLAGFFAASYMRGIPYVSIPTTLLGMVDASIGGKTGIDLPEGKNLVGAFWQPKLVWVDPRVLSTLPVREWKTGFAEIIKYGVIKNKAFFQWLESKLKTRSHVWMWPAADILKAIYVSAQTKAKVVSADVHEAPLKGGREILNFGHTLGHALEAALGYKKISHGEAISIGMVAAGYLSQWADDYQLQLILMFQIVGLPVHFPKLTAAQKKVFWKALLKDKKIVGGKLRFVLPKKIGQVEVRSGISISHVKKAMQRTGFQ